MRIGVLGGTFDPIHVGHLVAAVNVRHALELDKVLMVVANIPWQKVGERTVTPARDRLALVEAAVATTDGLEASSLEIDRGGVSYTVDTVEELRRRDPGGAIYLVIGADVVGGLDTWDRIDALRSSVTLAVVNRPGSQSGDVGSAELLSGWRVVSVEIPALEIASTDLRDRAATGRPLDYLVPEPAVRVIKQRGLYARER